MAVERGADIDALDSGSWTAAMHAASKGHAEVPLSLSLSLSVRVRV